MKKLMIILMSVLLVIPLTAMATVLTFDEFPSGTVISNQYAPQGVLFLQGANGEYPIITGDGAMPFTPVLSPKPPFAGDFTIQFINPVTNVSFLSGYWDDQGGGSVQVYDPSDILLGTFANGTWGNYPDPAGVYMFDFGTLVIGKIYFNSLIDGAGGDIDNLTFTAVPEPSTLLLLGAGLIGLVGLRKKFRK